MVKTVGQRDPFSARANRVQSEITFSAGPLQLVLTPATDAMAAQIGVQQQDPTNSAA
ncbi:hypothetical protein [Mycolicibacterium sp. PDY-3]|uniref:hypothetical protein n=1 Tax=Mycolicibacterium sp. PDY-3 TaxID=3376069 RepID=UPI00379B1143